jgi:hypothetical protein
MSLHLNEPQLDNQGSTKSRKVDGRRACNCLYPHLQDWMVQKKLKARRGLAQWT